MGRKPIALSGISDLKAIQLYKQLRQELLKRGQLNDATQEMLLCCAQWKQEADMASERIAGLRETEDGGNPLAIRRQMRNKAMAEGEMQRILYDLMLLPQKPRGRPKRETNENEERDDGGWESFDEADASAEVGDEGE